MGDKLRNGKHNKGKCALILSLCIFPFHGYAQSLEETVLTAISSHPVVKGSSAAYRGSLQSIREAESGYYPSIDLTADEGRTWTMDPSGSDGTEDNMRQSGGITISQPLFDGFATSSQVGAAEQNSKAANFTLTSARDEIIVRTIDSYLNVLRDRMVLSLSNANVTLHQSILKDMKAKAAGGSGNQADVLQAQSRLSLSTGQRARLTGALRNSEADFQEAVGNAPGTLEDVSPPAFDVPDSIDKVLATAIENNPKLNTTKHKLESAVFSSKQAESSFFPQFSLDGETNRERHANGQRGFRGDSSILLTMKYNLYSGGGDTARKRKALESEHEARLKNDAQLRLIKEDTLVAYNDLMTSRQEIPLLENRAIAADGVAKAYRGQLSIGKRSLLDVLDTENELFQAKVTLIRGRHDLIRRHYKLLAQMGIMDKSFAIPSMEN